VELKNKREWYVPGTRGETHGTKTSARRGGRRKKGELTMRISWGGGRGRGGGGGGGGQAGGGGDGGGGGVCGDGGGGG